MHRKYIGARMGCGGGAQSRSAGEVSRLRSLRGFSLTEMLVVMAIILVLMSASNVLFRSPLSRAGEPAARIARCIELARAKAVASNRNVAIHFDAQTVGSRELVLRFLWARPGQGMGSTLKELEFRRAERFSDIVISKDVAIASGANGAKPSAESLPAHDLAPGESLVVTTDGQVLLGTGSTGFPLTADQLEPLINLGVQPTIAGKVVAAVQRDVAIVQVQCASGTARVIQP